MSSTLTPSRERPNQRRRTSANGISSSAANALASSLVEVAARLEEADRRLGGLGALHEPMPHEDVAELLGQHPPPRPAPTAFYVIVRVEP